MREVRYFSHALLGQTHHSIKQLQVGIGEIRTVHKAGIANVLYCLFDFTFSTGMQKYLDMGIAAKKLVLGIPWYGYSYTCLNYTVVSFGHPEDHIYQYKSGCDSVCRLYIF